MSTVPLVTNSEQPSIVVPQSQIVVPDQRIIVPEWKVFDLKDALTLDFPEPKWMVDNLIPDGVLCAICGKHHAGKTCGMIAAGLEAVTFHKVWDRFDARNIESWLYIESEDPTSRVVERLKYMSKGLGIDPKGRIPSGFHWCRTGPFHLMDNGDNIRRLLDKYKPSVMVLSTLQGLLGGRNFKEQKDLSPIYEMLVQLVSDYCPIVLITHSPRDAHEKHPYGVITQDANCGVIMHFERKETGVRVELDEKYETGVSSFMLHLETETVMVGDRVAKMPLRIRATQNESASKLAIIQQASIAPAMSATAIAKQTGCSASYAARVLRGKQKAKPKGQRVHTRSSHSGKSNVN